jgi:hypothetical protein
MSSRPLRAARLFAGLAVAAALLLSPAGTVPAAASVPAVSSVGLCASPQPGHRACMVRVAIANGRRLNRPAIAPPSGYSPADIGSAYGISGAAGGAGQTVAVVDAYDNPKAESDLAAYRSQWGLPVCSTANGCFRKMDENGGTTYPAAAGATGWGTEIDLDIQAVSAACPRCHILLVEGASTNDADFMTSITTAAGHGATELSLSWGGCEQQPDQPAFDTTLNNTGLPITVSSGDSGYLSADNPAQQPGNGNTPCPTVGAPSFPASSPYVTAVGGTSLTRATNTRGWSETAWAYSASQQWGGGSGCSTAETKPAWQVGGCPNRMVADVSAVADPNTGLAVYDSYDSTGWGEVGGTSLSAPLIAGIYALSGGEPSGMHGGQPWYQSGVALNDITTGTNAPVSSDCSPNLYFCNAGTGYDGPTGVGSPAGALGAAPPPPPTQAVYQPVNPFRVADTRPGSGRPLAGQSLGTGQSDNVPIVGVDGVPANATAAVLNVTTTNGTAPSYITAYPGGTSVPLASNLNFVAGQTIANLVTVPIGANGGVGIYNHAGRADVIVDLEGYFVPGASPSAGLYNPLSPARITDTRPGSGQSNSGGTMSTGSVLVVPVDGFGGVPSTGVSSVVLNVTAVNPSLPSFLTAYAGGTGRPLASNLNFTRGTVVPNRVIVPVGVNGNVDIFNQQGRVDVVVDVGGWFTAPGGTTGSRFTAVPPTRVADTRPGSGEPLAGATMTTGSTRSVPIAGKAGVPATGVVAVAANVTVADTNHSSFLTVYPDATSRPLASDLNWVAGQVVPNLAITGLGADGGLAVFNAAGRVDVIVDVFGYWS